MKVKLTCRHAIVAPKGESIISCDFKNQEMYIAGVLSQDQLILNALLNEPETKQVVINNEVITYKNHLSDLHVLTALLCTHPTIFEGAQEHEYDGIARDRKRTDGVTSARNVAKRLNFQIIYDQTAESMSQFNHVPLELCKGWISKHVETFHKFHAWKEECKSFATARGWMVNNYSNRMRLVNEDNSKAAGASPARSGLNFMIQSLAADIGKLAIHYCYKYLSSLGIKLIGYVHDEILFRVPGECVLIPEKIQEGKTVSHHAFIPAKETIELGKLIVEQMARAESEILTEVADNGFVYPGLVGCDIAPFWAHG